MAPSSPKDRLIVVPLIRLPAEKKGASEEDVEEQRDRIRQKILNRGNRDIFEDKETWEFFCELGGDLMINAFACNFRIDGKVNQDVVS